MFFPAVLCLFFINIVVCVISVPPSFLPECNRYAFISGPHAGFGHMMSRIALGYVYALEKGATIVVRVKDFLEGGIHGTYDWVRDEFNFDSIVNIETVRSWKNLTVVRENIWHNNFVNTTCDVLFESCDHCCSTFDGHHLDANTWCYGIQMDVFAVSRPFMLNLYRTDITRGIDHLVQSRKLGKIDIVWHVRIGDLMLVRHAAPAFVKHVMDQLQSLFEGYPLQLFVLSEGSLSNATYNASFHESFYSYNTVYLDSLNTRQSFQYMVESSILVTSGSSFSSVATLFKSASKLAIQTTPRKGIYDVYDHAFTSLNGTLIFPPANLQHRANVIKNSLALYKS